MELAVVSLISCTKTSISPAFNSLTANRHTQLSLHKLTRRVRLGSDLHAFNRSSNNPTRLQISAVADGAAAPLSSDVIVLQVEGMMCEGCVSSVKRILETQSQVSTATVDLTSKSAVISPVSEATAETNWQKDLGEALAKHLTSCGFQSNLKDQGAIDGDTQS